MPARRPLAIAGIVLGAIGVLAIIAPFLAGISIAYAIGALLVVSGVVNAAHAVTAGSWRGRLWQVALSAVSLIAGLLVLANPVVGVASLTLLLIAYLVVDGVAELVVAARMAGAGRGWIAASGALSLILGLALWAGFPADAGWVLGVFVGASLLATGISMLLVAYGGRTAGSTAATPM
nr:DUF308 domain-containing protein [Saliphagus sp. LR7]